MLVAGSMVTPFTCQEPEGEVPTLAKAVIENVATVPLQIVVVPSILTLTGKLGFTVIVNELEVAGLPVAHGDALDVRTHDTTS